MLEEEGGGVMMVGNKCGVCWVGLVVPTEMGFSVLFKFWVSCKGLD